MWAPSKTKSRKTVWHFTGDSDGEARCDPRIHADTSIARDIPPVPLRDKEHICGRCANIVSWRPHRFVIGGT